MELYNVYGMSNIKIDISRNCTCLSIVFTKYIVIIYIIVIAISLLVIIEDILFMVESGVGLINGYLWILSTSVPRISLSEFELMTLEHKTTYR